MKTEITITISGPSGSGKSSLATSIQTMLVEKGLTRVRLIDPDGDSWLPGKQNEYRLGTIISTDPNITIKMVQTNRSIKMGEFL